MTVTQQKLIASKELDIALGSFTSDEGFVLFADRVSAAHSKCQRLGMPVTDLKTRFFTGFRCNATASWTTLIEIWQSGGAALTFENILQRGRDHQASLDLERTTATASGVVAHLGKGKGRGACDSGRGRGRGNHYGSYWVENKYQYKGGQRGKGKGSNGGKGHKGKGGKGRGRGGGGRGTGHEDDNYFRGECYRCGEYGHRSADCTAEMDDDYYNYDDGDGDEQHHGGGEEREYRNDIRGHYVEREDGDGEEENWAEGEANLANLEVLNY